MEICHDKNNVLPRPSSVDSMEFLNGLKYLEEISAESAPLHTPKPECVDLNTVYSNQDLKSFLPPDFSKRFSSPSEENKESYSNLFMMTTPAPNADVGPINTNPSNNGNNNNNNIINNNNNNSNNSNNNNNNNLMMDHVTPVSRGAWRPVANIMLKQPSTFVDHASSDSHMFAPPAWWTSMNKALQNHGGVDPVVSTFAQGFATLNGSNSTLPISPSSEDNDDMKAGCEPINFKVNSRTNHNESTNATGAGTNALGVVSLFRADSNPNHSHNTNNNNNSNNNSNNNNNNHSRICGHGKFAPRNKPLNEVASALMEKWYQSHIDHPYPSQHEKVIMAQQGGVTTAQVNSWFANRRNRSDNTRPKKNRKQLQVRLYQFARELEVVSGGLICAYDVTKRLNLIMDEYLS